MPSPQSEQPRRLEDRVKASAARSYEVLSGSRRPQPFHRSPFPKATSRRLFVLPVTTTVVPLISSQVPLRSSRSPRSRKPAPSSRVEAALSGVRKRSSPGYDERSCLEGDIIGKRNKISYGNHHLFRESAVKFHFRGFGMADHLVETLVGLSRFAVITVAARNERFNRVTRSPGFTWVTFAPTPPTTPENS